MSRDFIGRLISVVLFGLGVALVFSRLVWEDEVGLWVGHEHCWSDFPFHIAMMQRVAHLPASEWTASHPMVADIPLRYPPLMNVLCGMLMRAGLGVRDVLVLPHFILFILLSLVIYEFFLKCGCGPGSAMLAMAFFYLASGWGGILWFWEVGRGGGWAELAFPSNPYTRLDEYQWYSGNFISGMLIPQRTFLPGVILGLTVAILAADFFLKNRNNGRQGLRVFLLILCLSLLTLCHLHSTIVALALVTCFATAGLSKHAGQRWTYVCTLGLMIGAVGVTYLISYPTFKSEVVMTRIEPWFGQNGGFFSWVVMWFKLWGPLIMVVCFGLFLLWLKKISLSFCGILAMVTGLYLLVLANIILLQPIRWDNSKIFLWVYLFSVPVAAKTVMFLARQIPGGFFLAVILTFVLTSPGVSEFIRLTRTDLNRFVIGTRQEMRHGAWALENTETNAVFLTHKGINAWPMTWAARSIYLGFTGWMPNFQINPSSREQELLQAYQGNLEGVRKRLPGKKIYLVLGTQERHEYSSSESVLSGSLIKVYESAKTQVWKAKDTE